MGILKSISEAFHEGGWGMWPILFTSIIIIAITVERSVFLFKATVDKDKLPPALKGATETLRDLFFSNMSERAAKIMREDMAAMGPVRLKEVEEAQQYIVNVTKDLEARGEIIIVMGGDEDELIY